ncbi:MAG: PAS domain S-box protein [Candidatus Lokiarchaeota archaeon]|nr:PAS domain S-box protein [Candidatus Lokiarchaeota archaeon]
MGSGLFLITLLSTYSYLLFHSIAEVISIVISGGIFFIGWNSRKYMDNSFFLIIGISFLFISAIDLIHTLTYSGMSIILEFNANLPTQLWIAARYWQSISYLFALFAIKKKINATYLMLGGLIVISVLFILIFYGVFPTSYIVGIGLTPFKIISEYIINFIFLTSAIILYKFRSEFNRKIFLLIMLSISATIISELAFTFYLSVSDLSNFIGHIFKIIAFFFIYKAIIETALEDPFGLLLRKLKLSDTSLRRKADDLEEAYSEFNQMFNASAPLRVINKDYEIIRINETYLNLFSLTKEEIISKKCYDPDLKRLGHQCNTDLCSMKQIEQGKEHFEYELITKVNDNTNIVTLVRSVPYRNINGEFVGIIQNFTNITERSILELAMKKSEEKYRNLVEESLEGIWVIDDNTNTTFVNQSMAGMFGYKIDEMIGKKLYKFMDEDGKKLAEINFERRRQGIKEDHEFEFIHKSGRKIFTKIRTSPIFDETGKFTGAMAFVTDDTEQKIAREKIADMARFYTENPSPVLRLSKKYVLLANKASQTLFGIGEGSKIPEILIKPVKESFSKDKNSEIELKIKERIYSLFLVLIKGKSYMNIYGMDITARKEAKDRLKRFVSTVSHELRTPVSILTMSIEFLDNYKKKITPEVNKKLKEGISRNIYLLKDLIEDILTLSRIDEGKYKMEWKEYKPLLVFKDILTLMEPVGNEKNITFNINVSEEITLLGESKKIFQIFRIFIDNAIKYSRNSNTVEIKAIDHYKGKYNDNDRDGVLFYVKDNGIGISEDELTSIFQRFFRSEQVTDIPGTGLGLSIAKELIELHSGEVYVESEQGKGTTFYIFLPKIEKKINTK